jgi:hypothetical protein
LEPGAEQAIERRVASPALRWAALLCVHAAPLAASTHTARVAGVVSDPTGAQAARAAVTVVRPPATVAATTRADAAGAFAFDAVTTGS